MPPRQISIAVIGYFRKHDSGYSLWTRVIAPGLATLSLGTVFVLIVVNFNVLIGTEGFSPLSWILPALAVVCQGGLRRTWCRC